MNKVLASLVLGLLTVGLPAPTLSEDASPAATFDLARKLLHGDGMPKDTKQALELTRQAAEAGYPDAIGALGYFYANTIEVQQDLKTAAEWFRRGAEAGSAKAQLNYGRFLYEGKGVQADTKEGVKWMERAAAAGLPEAQLQLGLACLGSLPLEGVGYDGPRAYALLRPVAEAGNADAENAVGFISENAVVGVEDVIAAEDWYRRAARQGQAKAQANLGRLLVEGAGPGERERRVEGLKWLLIAETAGEPTAKNSVAVYVPVSAADEVSQAREEAAAFTPGTNQAEKGS